MKNRIDNLFRDKLSKHEVQPSQAAWDQLHDQQREKRKAVWGKRLAIAASFILICTVGFLGYKSIGNIDTIHESESISLNNEPVQTGALAGEEFAGEQVEKTAAQIEEEVEVGGTEKKSKVEPEKEELNSSNMATRVAEAEDKPVQQKQLPTKDEREMASELIVDDDPVQKEEIIEPELNESVTIVEPNESETSHEPEQYKTKDYPRVKIIYKASQDSRLVASGKQSIINKGINKITEFSDEHLLTENRKTKLRNTKDDLLALNFGKLLNKSNNDLEN